MLGRGTGGSAGASESSPIDGRVLLQPPAQQALGREPVEWVVRRLAAPVAGHRLHDSGERVDRRHVAVDEGERFAVVDADADLESNLPAGRVVDDPAHLEATDLAGDDTVFDDRRGAAGFDRRDEREMLRGRGGRPAPAARRRPARARARRPATP